MKKCSLILILFLALFDSQAQKPPIDKPAVDTSLFSHWSTIGEAVLTNDGKYVAYQLQGGRSPELVFQQVGGEWKSTFQNADISSFCDNSRMAVFLCSADSLCLLTLGSGAIQYISNVSYFQLFMHGKDQWLACLRTVPFKELLLRDLETNQEQSFPGVTEYLFSESGDILVVKTEDGKSSTGQSVLWAKFPGEKLQAIWKGTDAGNLILGWDGKQIAFMATSGPVDNNRSLYYFRQGTGRAVQLPEKELTCMDSNLRIAGISRFSRDGSKLFVTLQQRTAPPKRDSNMVSLDVWNYQDLQIQSLQLAGLSDPESYLAVMGTSDHRMIRLQQPGQSMAFVSDDVAVVQEATGDQGEWRWAPATRPARFLVSTRTGERKVIDSLGLMDVKLSPDGKYLVSRILTHYELYSYAAASGKPFNISQVIPVPVINYEYTLEPIKQISFAGWAGPHELLVYDRYDLWQVDLSEKTPPVNLTSGYGRVHKTELRLAYQDAYRSGKKVLRKNEPILLHSFNFVTKDEGFYQLQGKAEPIILSSGSYSYTFNQGVLGDPLIRARDAKVYLVRRCRASESPNYFWTSDLKAFHPLSEVYPEKNYNWLRSELVSFRTLEDSLNQGVLYKPEDFNPSGKYAVIIRYYEQKSDDLNIFRNLYDEESFSIPWFVSHGYVVFIPDIHYRLGENGRCAYNAVMGAADYLQHLSWVDTPHIAIMGHSFGGFETNYLVTHTDRFAAAISSSGMSDIVSYNGSLWGRGNSQQGYYQYEQGRQDVILWQNPGIYIENSPIFQADRISTPLLLLANKLDGNIPFTQGLELFMAMRRLGKRVWMLQYDGETHGVEGAPFIDFTLRSQQFFDHYLRGAPAPKWMVEGIPAKQKGFDNGLELEHAGVEPGPGL